MNRTQKQIVASIHSVDATWGVTDIATDDDDDDEDLIGANTDNDQDFQEEEE